MIPPQLAVATYVAIKLAAGVVVKRTDKTVDIQREAWLPRANAIALTTAGPGLSV